MDDNVSCCGRNCYECINFPHDCLGCNEVKGRVFWLEYVDEVICSIYNCCNNKMEYYECTDCDSYPCYRYNEEKEALPIVETPMIETIKPLWIEVKVS